MTCGKRNGTYNCQLPEGHSGAHQCTFAGVATKRRATWTDAYGAVAFSNACDQASDGYGHHWVPVRDGKTGQGEPAYVMRCKYCDVKQADTPLDEQ